MANERSIEHGRRRFLGAAGSLAALSLLGDTAFGQAASPSVAAQASGRRKLGRLDVSSVGLGVQNMSRTYQTTVPGRPEMLNIIRTAFDRGVTFYDAAEAYGPHEVERILGEGVAPFRNKVVIATKFGFDIDSHMIDNTGATAVGFTATELSELNAAVSAIEIQGARLPAGVLAMSGVEAPPKN